MKRSYTTLGGTPLTGSSDSELSTTLDIPSDMLQTIPLEPTRKNLRLVGKQAEDPLAYVALIKSTCQPVFCFPDLCLINGHEYASPKLGYCNIDFDTPGVISSILSSICNSMKRAGQIYGNPSKGEYISNTTFESPNFNNCKILNFYEDVRLILTHENVTWEYRFHRDKTEPRVPYEFKILESIFESPSGEILVVSVPQNNNIEHAKKILIDFIIGFSKKWIHGVFESHVCRQPRYEVERVKTVIARFGFRAWTLESDTS